jgi:hypothetical protein
VLHLIAQAPAWQIAAPLAVVAHFVQALPQALASSSALQALVQRW